ncbi:type II secretion protein [Thermococcus sp. EP1]|uniref:CpaF family protein n=1 Tax=Thermococcus sp. EP1 TaxID=1591054 RepID=UPI0006DB38F6|nr:CpaF family protein [Thermococcus sp. EP1]KPU63930.1 type II secretion protein [Thermococcus sp. EP1]
MEEKKKKRSGLSWIEEILNEEAPPLEEIIKDEHEEKPPSLRDKGDISTIPEVKTPTSYRSSETWGDRSLERILKRTHGPPVRTPAPTYYGEEAKVLDVYGNVRILKVSGEPIPIYEIRLPQLSEEEEKLVRIVRDRAIAEIQIDPESIPDPEERRRIFGRAVKNIMRELAPNVSEGRMEILVNLVVQNMIGYGKLDPLVRDDNLEEVMVIGTRKPVYVWHRKFYMCKTNIFFDDEREILNIIERIARQVGRRIDQQTPLLDARLPDGSRVNATIRPISLEGPTLTIRKFKKDPLTIIDLLKYGTFNLEIASLLWIFVDGLGVKPANVLVAGGTGSGKTTTLNALAMFIPPSERVISIEDTAELQLPIEHWVRLETRPPNIEGRGEITMDDLVKNTLRMRPDRIIVGEVRGPEARTMFTAMNTGHDGCMGTIHSNSARETIVRLESPPMNVPRIMIPALDVIIMQVRFNNRKKGTIRRITEIAEVSGIEGESVQLNTIYKYNPAKDELYHTGVPSRVMNQLAEHTGLTTEELLEERLKREVVLQWMVEKGIRSIEEVGHYIREFYINPEETLMRIEKDASLELTEKVRRII